MMRDDRLRHLLLAFVDLRGQLHTRLTSASDLESLCTHGTECFGGMPVSPGLRMMPDPHSLTPLPWAPHTAWLTCVAHLQGQAHPLCTRARLRQQTMLARAAGLRMSSGVECEFYLRDAAGAGLADVRDCSPQPCYEQAALMRQFGLMRQLLEAMERLGWDPYQADHEDAAGQFELNWGHEEALCTADRHVFFRHMVQTLAGRDGMCADFSPQPFAGHTGNGCHVHLSLWGRDGRNLFLDHEGPLGLAPLARYFIGGLLQHAAALCALCCTQPDSYERLHAPLHAHGDTWTVYTLTYSGDSRIHAIRVPAPGRLEFRLADGAVNPYLLQTVLLAAGLDGIHRRIDPGPPHPADTRGLELSAELRPPSTLECALRALEADTVLCTALGAPLVDAWRGRGLL